MPPAAWFPRPGRLGTGRGWVARPRLPVQALQRRTHFVVCGDDPLAHRLIEDLTTRYGADVTAILPSRRRKHGPQIARLARVRVIEADRLDAQTFLTARLQTAAALALTQQDDVGNIHAALCAQEIKPDIRLVIRMFNMSLGHGIRRLFADCAALSDAAIASPAFVTAALGDMAPGYVQLPGRTLCVARRRDVPARAVVCGLADTSGDGPARLLPASEDPADLVLAIADGSVTRLGLAVPSGAEDGADEPGGDRISPGRARGPWRLRLLARPFAKLGRAMLAMLNRKLWLAALALIVVLLVGTTVLDTAPEAVGWWGAFYTALLTAFGGAEPDPHKAVAVQVVETVVTVAGFALVPVITAAVVETVVKARIALGTGLPEPVSHHVVVVGLGNVGTRVIRQLHNLGVRVVAIDRSQSARGAQQAREMGIPLIIGDASQPETLRAASLTTSRALVCLSTDDVTNLEAALHARVMRPDLRVVLRLFDGDLADRLQASLGATISRSVSYLAAPAFAAAMYERQVIGTIPVGRYPLLIAEIGIGRRSRLDGAVVAAAHRAGEARVIAVTRGPWSDADWQPSAYRRLSPQDRLIVVATRDGLGRLLTEAEPDTADDLPTGVG